MTAPQPGRRADFQRNREAILDAAARCLSRDPRASVSEIATEAAVGRVTLYGHFASRTELLHALFARTMAAAEEALGEVDLEGDPADALDRLVAASWSVVGESRMVIQAAEIELGHDGIKELHTEPLARVGRLVRRGRRAGAFRTDLPEDWLITCFYAVLHTAAAEVRSGQLAPAQADRVVTATIRSLFRAPG